MHFAGLRTTFFSVLNVPQHNFLLHVGANSSSNNSLKVVRSEQKCTFCGHLNKQSVVEAEDSCGYCGTTWMAMEALRKQQEGDGKPEPP